MIIAIDGTASSGKSSIAKALSKKLSIPILGTGSIYRAIALKMLNFNIDPNDDEFIKRTLDSTILNIHFSNNIPTIMVDNFVQELDKLNSHDVSIFTPKIACKDFVREFVRKIQKNHATKLENIIVEGRDIGSVVFPNAEVKFFIDADLTTRATRRLNDYIKQGKNITLQEVINELETRDNEDRFRHLSPLIMTEDSIILDTSSLNIEDAVNKMIKIIKEKGLKV